MAGRRSYGDPCGAARALDVIGERWALLVVRELLFGPKRFTELSRGLPGMSQNVLAARLRELEIDGVVRNHRLGPPASTRVYELTERGYQLEDLLVGLTRWGRGVPLDEIDVTPRRSADALVLELISTFDAHRAGTLRMRVELCVEGDRFHAEIADGVFTIARGEARDVDVALDADAAAMFAVIVEKVPLSEATRSRGVLVTGDQRLAARFVNCFG